MTHTSLRVWLQSKLFSPQMVQRCKKETNVNISIKGRHRQNIADHLLPVLGITFAVCHLVVVVGVATTTVIGIDSFDDIDFCWLDCRLSMFVFGCFKKEGCTARKMRFNILQLTTNQAGVHSFIINEFAVFTAFCYWKLCQHTNISFFLMPMCVCRAIKCIAQHTSVCVCVCV